ncbi:uDENN domain containing protein [Histomonas meleagridis]|uniref:uDENN domain containing protein n=1 Tax=Histomonas meleagridis TaxID=135588 RepID=UPI0035596B6E|nr:uDENN domain containing protein [Histomonas meleagridis]KAH0806477.1 uDENN domain containing protein [Histomonas meleagridis]
MSGILTRMRRKFAKPKQKANVNLDNIAKSLSLRKAVGHVYDPTFVDQHAHLVQYFFILGPREPESEESSLLFAYPSHKFSYTPSDFSGISHLCFPTGIPKVPSKGNIVHQFVFGLNDGGTLVFGICSHVKLPPDVAKHLNGVEETAVFCFCSVTTMPMLATHFNFHEFFIGLFLGTLTENCKSSILIPENVLIDEFRQCEELTRSRYSQFDPQLKLNDENPLFASVMPVDLHSDFSKALSFYFRIHVDAKNPGLYTIYGDHQLYVSKQNETIIEIARHCFDVLFSCLSEENVIRFYRAILLEQKILIISEDLNKLTFCALAALPLILPMTYKCPFQPLMPDDDSFLDYLDSPVPFIFGALRTKKLINAFKQLSADITVVKLDENKIEYPLDIPRLPNPRELKEGLKNKIHDMKATPPKESDPKANEFWQERINNLMAVELKRQIKLKYSFTPMDCECILEKFQDYTSQFVNKRRLEKCRVRDTTNEDSPVIGFFKELYMIDVDESDEEFYSTLADTQTFSYYCQELFKT